MTIESAPGRLDPLRLQRYDAVVVTLGATDAGGLLPEARWGRAVRALIEAIRERCGDEVPIVWLGIRPQARVPQGTGLLDRRVDRHAGRLDATTVDVLAPLARTAFVALEPALRSIGEDRYYSSGSYRAIAERAVAALAPGLDRRHLDGGWTRTRSGRDGDPATEERRQRAVDELGVLDRPPSVRLERLVRSAADLFGTAWATVAVLDHDRLMTKAAAGIDGASTPRALTICDRTVQEEGAVVVGDATADPDFERYGMQVDGVPVRFYAGYPIETPDGYRLGTLCVFDPRPRDAALIDAEHLRDLALRVQNELWDEVGWTPAI